MRSKFVFRSVATCVPNYQPRITVAFSVAETPFDEPFDEDEAYGDEEEGVERANSQARESERGNSSVSEGEEAEGEEDEEAGAAPPVHFTVTVEKPGKTEAVLSAECTAQDGEMVVDYVNLYPSSTLAFAADAAASHERVARYGGPSFATLDEDLQVLIENYLEERGITPGLAVVLPDYVDFKEQKEYMRWLKEVKGFVDA
jgi:complement component 1 Q subcomponent-binding protein, mitochondrial